MEVHVPQDDHRPERDGRQGLHEPKGLTKFLVVLGAHTSLEVRGVDPEREDEVDDGDDGEGDVCEKFHGIFPPSIDAYDVHRTKLIIAY